MQSCCGMMWSHMLMTERVTSHMFINCGLCQGAMTAGVFVRKGQPEQEAMARQAGAIAS